MFVLLLLTGFVCHASSSSEPQCSKFPFEEALLEKMIRTEIKVEQFLVDFEEVKSICNRASNKVQDILTTVTATVNDIRKERKDINEDFLNLNKSTMAKIDTVIKDSNDAFTHQEKQIERMAKDLRDFQANLTDSTSTPIIGFRATDLTDYSLSIGQVLIFPTVAFNTGGGYDSSTGVFTAPISGLYLLTVQVCPSHGSEFNGKIMVDESLVGWVIAGDNDWTVCNTANTVTHIDAAAKASIITKSGAAMFSSRSHMMSFCGALLN